MRAATNELKLSDSIIEALHDCIQDRLFKGYEMTIYNQSLYVTLVSAIISLFGASTVRKFHDV